MEDYYSIQTADHHTSMFSALHTLQKQGVLCDVILAAEDGEVMAHKVLLMAASTYFRERLSPVVSPNASRIYLKGISVVELANLVKYIYTGKLLVAKETMDVTLEVSEILDLYGVIRGFKDIIENEQMKVSGDVKLEAAELETLSGQLISGQDVHMSAAHDGSTVSQETSTVPATTAVSAVDQAVPQTSDDIRVTQYCEDGSTITYTVEKSEESDVPTNQENGSVITYRVDKPEATSMSANETASGDYNFEFHPFEQQYMDVSAGTVIQTTQAPPNTTQQSTQDIVIDEQAQHQDLLSVAIMKLSDGSQALAGEGDVSSESGNGSVKTSTNKKSDKYVNGKIDTKIVTLSAGKISNDLGGQTSVYTVALDPSTIKKPLKMPRFQRRKTDKERIAEQNAKRYRQKKAELIAVKACPESTSSLESSSTDASLDASSQIGTVIEVRDGSDPFQVHTTDEVTTIPASLIEAQTIRFQDVLNNPSANVIYVEAPLKTDKDQLVTTIPHIEPEVVTSQSMDENVKDSLNAETALQKREDFGCSVNFDIDEERKTQAPKIIYPKVSGEEMKTQAPKIIHPKVRKNKQIEQRIVSDMNDVVPKLLQKNLTSNESAKTFSFQVISPSKKVTDKKHSVSRQTPEKNSTDKIHSINVLKKKNSESLEATKLTSPSKKTTNVVETAHNSVKQADDLAKDMQNDSAREGKQNYLTADLDQNQSEVSKESQDIEDGRAQDCELNEHQTDTEQCEASKDSPDKPEEKNDTVTSDMSRSSATKRKGKVPRRLPLTPGEKLGSKTALNRRNIPIVRTRRTSRNEGSVNKRKSKSKNAGLEETDQDKTDGNDSVVEMKDKIGESHVGIKDKIIIYDMVTCNTQVTDADDLAELEKEGYTQMDENEELGKETSVEHAQGEQIMTRKFVMPNIQLGKTSSSPLKALDKTLKPLNKDDLSEGQKDIVKEPSCDDDSEEKGDLVELTELKENETKLRGTKRRTTRSDFSSKRTKITTDNLKNENSEISDKNTKLSSNLKPSEKELNTSAIGRSSTRSGQAKSVKKSDSFKMTVDADIPKGKANTDKNVDESIVCGDTDPGAEMTFVCPEDNCGYSSKTIGNLRRHRAHFHNTTGTPTKPLVKVPAQTSRQEPDIVKDDSHICQCCRSNFRTRIALKGHLKSKLMFGNCKCVYCDEQFKKGSKFFNHLRQHHDISVLEDLKHFSCKECDFIGYSNKEMNSHYLAHKGKIFKCSRCDETFLTIKGIRTHVNDHKEKHECAVCNFSTYTKASLMTHIKLKHDTVKEKYDCQFCLYRTPLIGNLRKHMQIAHELTVVTKQSKYNRHLYKDFKEGTLLTKEGQVFDPETTPLPKLSNRIHKVKNADETVDDDELEDDDDDDDSSELGDGSKSKTTLKQRVKKSKVPLMTLSSEDFTKEIMKRHEAYLKKPEKVHRVMSKSLAVATAHPSFPQASPSVRVNKANKLYHTPKPNHSYTELLASQAVQYFDIEPLDAPVDSSLPSVSQEVIIPDIHNIGAQQDGEVMVALPVGDDGKVLQVMIDQDGQNTTVTQMDVVNALLEAGHHIEVQEEVEIQNE